ncbi:uncharacterized protein B0T15DRAFT_535963 [Chaetomium strumarium]|uniref:Uncharacterized protein n=1 Tax=Chaetomium strumarium TaxID=1170767 RepID=A0AAJ0GQH1_9PEZI|nr:hypothetical protein B0T15DRAFT_535963 [Chaetomium strumarium]
MRPFLKRKLHLSGRAFVVSKRPEKAHVCCVFLGFTPFPDEWHLINQAEPREYCTWHPCRPTCQLLKRPSASAQIIEVVSWPRGAIHCTRLAAEKPEELHGRFLMGGAAPCWSADPGGSPWPTSFSAFSGACGWQPPSQSFCFCFWAAVPPVPRTGSDMGQTAEPVNPCGKLQALGRHGSGTSAEAQVLYSVRPWVIGQKWAPF